jgi:hypothetical protein
MTARSRVLMNEHIKFVKVERTFLGSQRFFCCNDPDNFYMEIDWMDQSKTNLPHYPNCPKDINKDLLMQIHVTGVRYCDGRPADIYLYTSHFAHDSACTCTVIFMSIIKVEFYIGEFLHANLYHFDNKLNQCSFFTYP